MFAASVGFPVMTLTLPASYNPSSLHQDFQSSAQGLAVDLYNNFHQLLDECSLITIRVVTSLYRRRPGQAHSLLLLRVLAVVFYFSILSLLKLPGWLLQSLCLWPIQEHKSSTGRAEEWLHGTLSGGMWVLGKLCKFTWAQHFNK